MNRIELEKALQEKAINPRAYSLGGGLPNEQYVLAEEEGKWLVYYSERGQRSGLKVFDSEDSACRYFLKELSEDSSTQT